MEDVYLCECFDIVVHLLLWMCLILGSVRVTAGWTNGSCEYRKRWSVSVHTSGFNRTNESWIGAACCLKGATLWPNLYFAPVSHRLPPVHRLCNCVPGAEVQSADPDSVVFSGYHPSDSQPACPRRLRRGYRLWQMHCQPYAQGEGR